jgi:prolyl-tRNA editing enzyme YbaK/EbsC (Cys-tRNA(Pro) deacylase)
MTPHERVQEALRCLGIDTRVVEYAASTGTAQDAADAVGCELGQIVKTLFFLADGRPTIVLAAGDRHVDTAALAEILGIGRKRLKMGSPGEVLARTGYPVGAVPPVALAEHCDAIVDDSLKRFTQVWAAAGSGHAVFGLDPHRLASAVDGQWANITRARA